MVFRTIGLLFIASCMLNNVIKAQKQGERDPDIFKQGSQCEKGGCFPATGDLMIGRESRLSATSTCGLTGPERYCIVSHLEDQKNKCFNCDSRVPYSVENNISHRVENIITTFEKAWKQRWWQARNGLQNVSIQLDLEAEFHFTHLIMKFKTFRPAAMLIERSYDFGKTWKVYRYFAQDCSDSFTGIPTGPVMDIQTVICESKYSDVAPSSGGEVIFRVLPPNVKIKDPYSPEVQDLLKVTNIRVNFTKLHTLGDNLLNSGESVKEKYYYSLYTLVIRGSCSCYGHASHCSPLPGQEENLYMVHGKCECTHFTQGLNCERCNDFYNDLPWRPAHGRNVNACKKCNCNEHSTKCHFDAAVYVATNYQSGGVCDDCQHNTMGRHCEQCKPYFFHDPERNITDPYVCQSCDCDPTGSEHNGECESRSNQLLGTKAGHCICKRFVQGARCDMCISGYWNLSQSNPEGCEACNCYRIGTVGTDACDIYTGECRCKRYVRGKICDECIPGYWDLSEHPQGCRACDCDVGGAYEQTCDQSNGLCRCRPNIVGDHCRDPAPYFFVPALDWLMYEAEFATATGKANVVERQNPKDRPRSWTGTGFMRVYEGSSLEFSVYNIPYSTHYDVVIRYEPQSIERWHDVKLTVVRPDSDNLEGVCANVIFSDHEAVVDINPSYRHNLVIPSSCLEKGKEYKIRLDFRNVRSGSSMPDENILIDSIVLIPSADHHPVMQYSDPRNIGDDYERYRCVDSFLSPAYQDTISNVCRPIVFSASAIIHNGAQACDCDPIGSEYPECDTIGGQCTCRPNVVGRRCDQCAPGTYGFGLTGCFDCMCNIHGSQDINCDLWTGQCKCVDNAHGLRCGDCERGFYGFPYCRPCQCNGLSDVCDSETGRCTECRDYSAGDDCSRCVDGFYGNPRPEYGGCKACMCPGGEGSRMQHADTCRLDDGSGQVICDCKPGFAGLSCDHCAMNYYGDPLRPGGTCTKCFCNDNIDHFVPESCDSVTGECLKCLFNTKGQECERCHEGYYGDAPTRTCTECTCNRFGTHVDYIDCNHYTGQCNCYPNVIGRDCDQCVANYWNLASGKGCEACECDPTGSVDQQCDLRYGQCRCIEGRGGMKCNECPPSHWGTPITGCRPCNCTHDGSRSNECNKETGQCECEVGVTGLRCDRCARGTTGSLPHCVPCGECYDNWEKMIAQMNAEANRLLHIGTDLKLSGSKSVFTKEFTETENKLEEIKMRILDGAQLSHNNLDQINKTLITLGYNLTKYEHYVLTHEGTIDTLTGQVEEMIKKTSNLSEDYKLFNANIADLRNSAVIAQEQDVAGAFASIQESYNKLNEFDGRILVAKYAQTASKLLRDEIASSSLSKYNETFENQILESINEMNEGISLINQETCGSKKDSCEDECGGAGCGHCGQKGCSGVVSSLTEVHRVIHSAEKKLSKKTESAKARYLELSYSKNQCQSNVVEARKVFVQADQNKNRSETAHFYVKEVHEKAEGLFAVEKQSEKDVETVVNRTLDITISMTPKEIEKLAEEIVKAADQLKNVDDILYVTRQDLYDADTAKYYISQEREKAEKILNQVKQANNYLEIASDTHVAIEESLKNRSMEADDLDHDMELSFERMNDTKNRSVSMRNKLNELKPKLYHIKSSRELMSRKLQFAEDHAKTVNSKLNEVLANATELERRYEKLAELMNDRLNNFENSKERMKKIKERAWQVMENISNKTDSFNAMGKEFQNQETSLSDYSTVVGRLMQRAETYAKEIQEAAVFQHTCSS